MSRPEFELIHRGNRFIIRPIPNPGPAILFGLIGIALAVILPVAVWKAIFKAAENTPEVPYIALICFGTPVAFMIRYAYRLLKSMKDVTTPGEVFTGAYVGGALLFFFVALIISRTGIIPSMYTGWGSLFWDIVGIGFISFLAGIMPGIIATAVYSPIYMLYCRKVK